VIFGSISYLNLLPFQIFLKRYIQNSATKMALNYKRDVPSKINKALNKRYINAGFISSIFSTKHKCSNLGIIANRAVYSVFIIDGDNKKDKESASSNILADILELQGEVIIGDKALKYYLNGGKGVDLTTIWYKKTSMPFVFARLCYNSYKEKIKNIEKRFLKQPIKIPQYILKREAKKRDITTKQLLWYLKFINYKIDHKAEKSLKLFLKKARNHRLNQH